MTDLDPDAIRQDARVHEMWEVHVQVDDALLWGNGQKPPPDATIQLTNLALDLPMDHGWELAFASVSVDDPTPVRPPTRRELNRMARTIARCFDVPLWVVGVTPPPLAIDGHAYRRRQRNRVKRRRR